MVPLSVLDLSPVAASSTPRQAILDSVALAGRCDALGYTRYWVAEHHNMANIATSAPEVLVAHIAATTTRMRIGAGGIMLPNHNPLRVVEMFRTLEALHPGRIDLGLGRAPGKAERMAAPIRLAVVRNRTGRRAPIASVEEALAYRLTRGEQAIADELMLSTLIPDRGDRLRSYERVSTVAGLF